MKKLLLTVFFIATSLGFTLSAHAQTAPSIQWDKTIGFNGDDVISSVIQTSDGGYIIGAHSGSNIGGDKSQNSRGGIDYWLIKTDASGNKIWDRTYGGSDYEDFQVVQQTSDGGYILGGSSRSMISGEKSEPNRSGIANLGMDYWVVKVDSMGTLVWDKTFGGSGNDELYALQQTSDGGYIVGGFSNSGVSVDKSQHLKGGTDYWILKLNANGVKIWDKTIGGTDTDELYSLQQTSDGGYILGGLSYSSNTADKSQPCYDRFFSDYWVVKLDANGVKVWDRTFGGMTADVLMSLQQTSDGGYILGGSSTSSSSPDKTQSSIIGSYDYWVIKLNSNGIKTWDKTFGGNSEDLLYTIKQTNDGGYLLGGSSKSGISGSKTQPNYGSSGNGSSLTSDFWLLKIDGTGNKIWDKGFGGSQNDIPYYHLQTKDGGYLVAGQSESGISNVKSQPALGSYDAWIIKLGPACTDLNATVTATCTSIGTDLTLNISGLYSTTNGTPRWTLNYEVNGVIQTATGTTSTFSIAQNAPLGTVYEFNSMVAGSCTTNLTQTITIQPVPNAPSAITGSNCGPGQVSLTATGVPSGGSYILYNSLSGGIPVATSNNATILTPFISGTTTFYLAVANSGGCESTRTPVIATIIPLTTISVGPNFTICATAQPVQLTGNPAGGVWSGFGVSATGLFTPNSAIVGNQIITYSITQNGCTTNANQTIMVTSEPVVNAGSSLTICANAALIQLSGFSPAGGTWSGPGVTSGGLFNPNSSLVGVQTLTYSITQNGCTVTSNKVVNVTGVPVVNAGLNETVFVNTSPFQLNGMTPLGGTWSGPGVSSSGLFTPSATLIGTLTLNYAYTSNGCIVTANKQITIPNPPSQPLITIIAPDTLVSSVIGNSYEWKRNGSILPVSTRKIKVAASGLYAVRVISTTNGPSIYSQDFNFVISGIKESEANSFNLFPNPTQGMVNLELSHRNSNQVNVYNTLGQIVLSKEVVKTGEEGYIQIDLSKEAKGVYTIQVLSDNQVTTRKVVLQ